MPLIQGCSVQSSRQNYNRMLNEGRRKDIAYAVALATARKNKHKCLSGRKKKIEEGKLFEE